MITALKKLFRTHTCLALRDDPNCNFELPETEVEQGEEVHYPRCPRCNSMTQTKVFLSEEDRRSGKALRDEGAVVKVDLGDTKGIKIHHTDLGRVGVMGKEGPKTLDVYPWDRD